MASRSCEFQAATQSAANSLALDSSVIYGLYTAPRGWTPGLQPPTAAHGGPPVPDKKTSKGCGNFLREYRFSESAGKRSASLDESSMRRCARSRVKKQTAHSLTCGPSGGLLWIDQEVVTLRGLFGNSGLPARPTRRAEINPYSPIVCGL